MSAAVRFLMTRRLGFAPGLFKSPRRIVLAVRPRKHGDEDPRSRRSSPCGRPVPLRKGRRIHRERRVPAVAPGRFCQAAPPNASGFLRAAARHADDVMDGSEPCGAEQVYRRIGRKSSAGFGAIVEFHDDRADVRGKKFRFVKGVCKRKTDPVPEAHFAHRLGNAADPAPYEPRRLRLHRCRGVAPRIAVLSRPRNRAFPLRRARSGRKATLWPGGFEFRRNDGAHVNRRQRKRHERRRHRDDL